MSLKWISKPKKELGAFGVNFGMPWKKGQMKEEKLQSIDFDMQPAQSWPTAFWPDGSVKWTGHSCVINSSEKYKLEVSEDKQGIVVKNGLLICTISRNGGNIFTIINNNGKEVVKNAYLSTVLEERAKENDICTIRKIALKSRIETAEVERKGPVSAVIKITGMHESDETKKFPFTLRLYFFAEAKQIKLVHTFFYDGDPHKDYVAGVGIVLSTEFTGSEYNKHVRIADETGIYSEPSKLLFSRRFRTSKQYEEQIKGKMVDLPKDIETTQEPLYVNASGNAVWNDYKLVQLNNSWKMSKRTNDKCAWVEMLHGKRAGGMMYSGGESGGIAVAIQDFWQKHPASLELSGLSSNNAQMGIWFWSKDGEAMDLRHYSETHHVPSAYEGFPEMRATPYGIANTGTAFIAVYDSPPSNDELMAFAEYSQNPPLLVQDPGYYYETKATGIFSMPDRTHPIKNMLEENLDRLIDFYKEETEQRNWYGYWNYGDFMHTYDAPRHQWCYDLGGYAWQNTELVPNLWLWYAFLRSGRTDIFRLAEAMTRHTSEVDRYHFGEYAPLGSRHNVSHWGCGCKEARISMACLQKYYYYLTTDDRTLELLTEVKDADLAFNNLNPMREFYGEEYGHDQKGMKTHARLGPDWSAFCSNWMSQWERTQDETYKQNILKGLDNIKATPFKLLSGPTFGYNTETKEMMYMGTGNAGGYHMVIAFGAPQVFMELAELLDDDKFRDMIAEFGRVYAMSDEEKKAYSNGDLEERKFSWPMFSAAVVAYAAQRNNNADLAKFAWDTLLSGEHFTLPVVSCNVDDFKNLKEVSWITTNAVAQWALNAIVCLELIGDRL